MGEEAFPTQSFHMIALLWRVRNCRQGRSQNNSVWPHNERISLVLFLLLIYILVDMTEN